MTGVDWKQIAADDRAWRRVLLAEPCVWCGRLASEVVGGTGRKYRVGGATPMTIEHIMPRGHGPRRHWSNQAPACWNCNHTRGSRGMLMFMVARRAFALGPGKRWNAPV